MYLLVLVGGLGALCGWAIPAVVALWCQRPKHRFLIALVTASLFVLMVESVPGRMAQAAFCLLCLGLVVLTLIDLQTYRLPREISYTTLVLGVPILTLSALVNGESFRIWGLVLGAVGALIAMGTLYLMSRGAMGDGDVRLSPLLGAFLGWLGLRAVVHGFLLSFILGAVAGVLLLILTKADRRTALPFGPFLAAGTLATIVLPPSALSVLSGGW